MTQQENAERRQHRRQPVSWRIRVWLGEKFGYVSGKATDASSGGLGVVFSSRLASRLLRRGAHYRIEVEAGGQPVIREDAVIRYAAGERVGLAFERELPFVAALATFDSSKAATIGTLTGQL